MCNKLSYRTLTWIAASFVTVVSERKNADWSPLHLNKSIPTILDQINKTISKFEYPNYPVIDVPQYILGGLWPLEIISLPEVPARDFMCGLRPPKPWLTNVYSSSQLCTNDGFYDKVLDIIHILIVPSWRMIYFIIILALLARVTTYFVLITLTIFRRISLIKVETFRISLLGIIRQFSTIISCLFNVIYVVSNYYWNIPLYWCDLWLAMDVIGSTCSIFNLVAISIDRYIAVTNPLQYAHHKNNKRIFLTIAVVWLVSIGIGVPVFFINTPPENQDANTCIFHSAEFIIISSLSSFYIPCIIMIYLYIRIFKALNERAKKKKKPKPKDIVAGSVIENVAQTKKLAETTLGGKPTTTTSVETNVVEEDKNTNNTSNSQDEDEEDEDEELPTRAQDDDCHIINNPKVTEPLPPLQEEKESTTDGETVIANPTTVSATKTVPEKNTPSRNTKDPESRQALLHQQKKVTINSKRNGSAGAGNAAGAEGGVTVKKDKKAAARFTIYKVNKASKKKRENKATKRENKATKTLAIVLGGCWVPFFTVNISILHSQTMLYMNIFPIYILLPNPIIYTIFNPEFRKSRKILLSAKLDMFIHLS
ncbi:unnamed protein product, partial [Meganyctiphanes norvegica]